MEEKNLLFKKQTTNYTTNIYKPFCSIIVEKPKNTDEDAVWMDIIPVRQTNIRGKEGFFEFDRECNDENTYLENYGNPLARLNMTRNTYVIEQKEKNISIKHYYYHRYRNVNKKYFLVRKTIKYLTFNFNKKMFYAGEISSKRKKVTKKVQKFDVKNLKDGTNGLFYSFFHSLNEKSYDTINIFYDVICDKLNFNIDKNLPLEAKHFLIYLKIKKIKYPDTFANFINLYFKLSDLKKHKNNLVNYVMDFLGVKGNNARKILNTQLNIDTRIFSSFYHLLGVDYFNKIKNTQIFSLGSNGTYNTYWAKEIFNTQQITNSEKSNIVSIIEKCKYNEQLETILEHIEFKNKLAKHGEIVKIRAKNLDDFNDEHEEWSKLVASYKTGIIERYYGEKQNEIEKTIICDKDMFFPVLLKGTVDYEKESTLQKNCVRTYVQKPDCLIISLRKNNPDSDERLTIEYQFRKNEILNVQTRARFNKMADEEWSRALSILNDTVKKLYKDKVIELPKMTKTYRNGRKIETNAIFPDEEKMVYLTPEWDNPIIYSETTNYLFDDFDYLP